MKKSLFFFACLFAPYVAICQNSVGYIRATSSITAVSGPAISIPVPSLQFNAGVLAENGLFAEVLIGEQAFEYSNSTYSTSLLGAALGYSFDLNSFELRLAVNADMRLGGQQVYQGVPYALSINPADISFHPQVSKVFFDGTGQVDLSLGYKMGLLNLDSSDPSPTRLSSLTLSLGISFGEVQFNEHSDHTLSP
jgi:hypothetical protein